MNMMKKLKGIWKALTWNTLKQSHSLYFTVCFILLWKMWHLLDQCDSLLINNNPFNITCPTQHAVNNHTQEDRRTSTLMCSTVKVEHCRLFGVKRRSSVQFNISTKYSNQNILVPRKFNSSPQRQQSVPHTCGTWEQGSWWPRVTSWPRCIYRWLYQLIGGLQHVESTQASKLQRKDSASAPVGFSL